ncbi:LOW QUALITY PROTEIN: trafficking kinesin-binding protein 1 [Silurus meridionalis]|uniref:LOW QUALITY PROTEIN: trafficking kinesin-binding protein 1 n=1 Tax=Silurus meridionalis TaxID=175797 RepID=UPI001EEB69AD|nr:LOW QUALITY PROTEIN: trafficking kinesin-binding protein 1 [Silurus meridionalis]
MTDVCNSTDLPEVEIISLLEEQLPHYQLRADTIYGYDHDDWLHTPLISPDINIDLTVEQIEETLKYFLLCADRVGQMTKTYNDIDAVTRLLEEKERDLELAARIGQSLLKKNKTLSERNEFLEEQVEHIREEVSQLRHDLSMKDELLQFYTSAAEESEGESVTSTPIPRNDPLLSVPNFFPLDSLQKKLQDLEEENVVLRSEACHLETETISYEEKEQQLVNDCVKELRDANLQISSLAEELAKKTEDASRQQEEITHLLSQIVDLQKKVKCYALENEELTQHLGAAKDAQRQLTAELRELEDKYAECMEMLHEAQEELKNFRNKTVPQSTPRRFHSLGFFPMDSLAAEIEGTMRKEIQMSDPEVEDQRLHPKKVFQTVRNLNQVVRQRSLCPSPMNIPGSNQTSSMNSRHSSCLSTPRSSVYGGEGSVTDNRTNSMMLESHSPQECLEDSNKKPGIPGTPGSHDLEAALRRLSLRRDNYLSERHFFEEERERKLLALAAEKREPCGDSDGEGGGSLTHEDSILSLGTLHSVYSFYSNRSYLPEKLQIVKPLEGSATLHAWQQLAQPNLGGILDARPGVVTKGFRHLHLDLEEVFKFTDLEEDEPGAHQNSPPTLSTSGLGSLPCSPKSNLHRPGEQHREERRGPEPGVQETNGEAQDEAENLASAYSELTTTSSLPAMCCHSGFEYMHFPGKCMSHTNSTYTFTTCRILHPSDELTRVTPSVMAAGPSMAPCVKSINSVHSTPASTPCTPRRLSLAESFTNLREHTKTTSTSLGLVRLLQQRGISATVYNPHSWDRAENTPNKATCFRTFPSAPGQDTLPSTPPNSPTKSKPSSPVLPIDFSPSDPPYENFLASRPASSILKEMRGAETKLRTESQCQTDMSIHNLQLVDKVKRFSLGPRAVTPGPGLGLATPHFGTQPGLPSPIGGLTGIRRNRSYPVMVGASMAMKGLGPHSEDLLLPPKHSIQDGLSEE